ncbi:MAG: hypothetical protein QMD11_01520 [Smithella sp.]|nr:hypothetical protein [Smithella sp.]
MTKLSIVYLHVGADKTGSTTIQNFLDTNRQVLKGYRYCYPSVMTGSLDDISSTYSHHLVAAYFSNKLPDLDYYRARTSLYVERAERDRANRYMEFITQGLREGGYNALILSYEGFDALKIDELQALKTYLLSIAEEVRVIYYLRPRFSYGLSAMSQRISLGEPAWKYHPPVNHYRHRLLALESVFGKDNMLVRRFSKDGFRDGDLISDFCYEVGLGHGFLEESNPAQPRNESLSELAIRVGDALVFLLNCVDGPKGIEFYKLFFHDLKLLGGRPYRFDELQNNIIYMATKEDSLFVRNNYGIELNDSADTCDDRCPAIANESAESVARYLIRSKLPNLRLADERYAPVAGRCIQEPRGCLKFLGYQLSKGSGQQQLTVTVRVENNSCSFWGGDLLPVNLSYRWVNKKDTAGVDIDSVRTPLPGGRIAAGEVKEAVLSVLLPEQDGNYSLKLTMVQEFCAWLDDIGFKAQVLDVKVAGGEVIAISPRNSG